MAGFEYEIINAVARSLGRRAEFVQNDWNGLIPGLHRSLYDCVICGIEITPDKADEVRFSIPYYFTFEQFVARRGTPALNSLDQLRGRLATQTFDYFGTGLVVALLYLVLGLPFVRLARLLEERLAKGRLSPIASRSGVGPRRT